MCALRCSLHAKIRMSWLKKYAFGIYLVLYTREPIEHDRTVTPWDVINTCLEQSSGNAGRYCTWMSIRRQVQASCALTNKPGCEVR